MDIRLAKPVLPEGQTQIRVVATEIRQIGDRKDRVLEFVASDETQDRYKDIVVTDGWEVAAYKKNPVFLWGHSHSGLPIGRSQKVFVGDHPSRKGKQALIHQVKFAEKGANYDEWPVTQPTPETVYRLYTSEPRMLNAVSVGFLPLAYEPIMEKEGDKEYWTGGFKFTQQELLELSAVTVPANPSALIVNGFDATGLRQSDLVWLAVQCDRILKDLDASTPEGKTLLEQWREAEAKARGLNTGPRIQIVVPELPAEPVDKQTPEPTPEPTPAPEPEPAPVTSVVVEGLPLLGAKNRELISTMQKMLQQMLDEDVAKEVEVPEDEYLAARGVSPGDVSTVKAPEDTAWEAPSLKDFTDKSWGDLSDGDKRRIAKHFAWAASMPPDSFGDLKLPHHSPKLAGKVVWRGVANAAARMNQAAIPSADLGAVKAHLARHYKAFGKPVPWKDAEEPAPVQQDSTDPQAVSELAQRMDAALQKLGASGAPKQADTSETPTASVAANPYESLLDATHAAADLVHNLEK